MVGAEDVVGADLTLLEDVVGANLALLEDVVGADLALSEDVVGAVGCTRRRERVFIINLLPIVSVRIIIRYSQSICGYLLYLLYLLLFWDANAHTSAVHGSKVFKFCDHIDIRNKHVPKNVWYHFAHRGRYNSRSNSNAQPRPPD